MSDRIVYHVVPASDAGWEVKREGAGRAASQHRTKAEALDHARRTAKDAGLSQVIVHKGDGTIQTEYTYGDDPYPPPG